MTTKKQLEHHRDISRKLTEAVNNFRHVGSEPMKKTAIRLLREHIALTLKHGSIARISSPGKVVPGYEDLSAIRGRAVDVAAIWRRIDALKKAGIPVDDIAAPCRETAARLVVSTTIELKKAGARAYNAQGPAIQRRRELRRAKHRTPIKLVSSAALIAEARNPKTANARRDEIWREAKKRRWTAQEMRRAFDPVTK